MIEVLSYGNQIRQGEYTLHSKFHSAANFISECDFVSLVNQNIGPGPLNIVLHGMNTDSLNSLEIGKDCFYLDGSRFFFRESEPYDPYLGNICCDRNKYTRNLTVFENALSEFSPPKSLAFLINSRRRKEFTSSFEREYIIRFEMACERIFSGDILNGIGMIKGLGPGLTPSGDDFIAGVLMSLNILKFIFQADFSKKINMIYKASKGDNPFSNSLLLCSARGFLNEKFKNLVRSVICTDEQEVVQNTSKLFTIGETSGADQGVGLLMGLKRSTQ